MKRLLLIIALLVGSFSVSYSQNLVENFDKAGEAFSRGEYAEAFRHWKVLADLGHAKSQYNIGNMFEKGRGVTKDYKVAVKWYRLAADQGLAAAQYNLGLCFELGKGVEQNNSVAEEMYSLAAKQGLPEAQISLGSMYDKAKDYKVAVKWYRLAAEQGRGIAQTNLGVHYALGEGVKQNSLYAYMWFNTALYTINNPSQHRRVLTYINMITEKMTSAEISEGKKMVRECVKNNYRGC